MPIRSIFLFGAKLVYPTIFIPFMRFILVGILMLENMKFINLKNAQNGLSDQRDPHFIFNKCLEEIEDTIYDSIWNILIHRNVTKH